MAGQVDKIAVLEILLYTLPIAFGLVARAQAVPVYESVKLPLRGNGNHGCRFQDHVSVVPVFPPVPAGIEGLEGGGVKNVRIAVRGGDSEGLGGQGPRVFPCPAAVPADQIGRASCRERV